MPGGRPTKYKPEFAEQAYQLAMLKLTEGEIARHFEVDHSQIRRWKKRYSEFRRAIARGKDPADARMAVSLYERGVGFTGPDGRYYPPDVNAASLWLRNRQPHLWRDRHEHEHSGGIEQRVLLMTREQRLAEANRLLEDAQRYLPLLEQHEAEEAATIDTAASGGEESGAGR